MQHPFLNNETIDTQTLDTKTLSQIVGGNHMTVPAQTTSLSQQHKLRPEIGSTMAIGEEGGGFWF